jgi:hypothetical protein
VLSKTETAKTDLLNAFGLYAADWTKPHSARFNDPSKVLEQKSDQFKRLGSTDNPSARRRFLLGMPTSNPDRNSFPSLNSGLCLHSGPFDMLSLIWARIHASCRDERRSAIHGQQIETE